MEEYFIAQLIMIKERKVYRMVLRSIRMEMYLQRGLVVWQRDYGDRDQALEAAARRE